MHTAFIDLRKLYGYCNLPLTLLEIFKISANGKGGDIFTRSINPRAPLIPSIRFGTTMNPNFSVVHCTSIIPNSNIVQGAVLLTIAILYVRTNNSFIMQCHFVPVSQD
uniref:Uncharacterized protein n=1 Tax=Pyxicephalus adspersus TaxID=30357 RepID=A0AAV3AKB7_PYXAD|nr:TPA: hypothetical protein GDO54_010017 [Pyxicephalus adspersus]